MPNMANIIYQFFIWREWK